MELFPLQPYCGKRVCVALSGGADSVCLMHYFHSHAKEYSISLSALTCEHGIRGERSLADLRFVEELCKSYSVPLTVFRADVPALAAQNGRGLEEEGRLFRYECYEKIRPHADFIATAHHKNDYAETVLFRLIRGTGIQGISAFSHEGVVRPLLNVSRSEIDSYIKENGLPFVTDESNNDEHYTRNFLRRSVLPLLEQAVQGAGEHLVAFALRAGEDDAFLQSLALKEVREEFGEYHIPVCLEEPLFVRAVIAAMNGLGIKKDYTAKHIESLIALCLLQSGKKISLPRGAEAVKEGKEIVLYLPIPSSIKEIPFTEGKAVLGGYTAALSEEEGSGLRLDIDAIPAGARYRTRREGDVITPYGGGTKSLKKFLTDKKIPARVGRALPLLACGSEVLAVFGVEISEKVKVTKQTKRIGYLSLTRNK